MSPVRNIQSIGGQKPIPIHVFIPPVYSPLYKIEVIRSDGTIDDITDLIYEGELTDGATDTIGNFTFTVDNSNNNFTGKWIGNEILYLYCDYDLDATTKRFRGRIEKVSYQDNLKIEITGRSESLKLLKITVTKSYSNIESSLVLKGLLDEYAPEFTYTNVNTSSTFVTVNWYQKPLWECIQELCYISGFDCYIDSDLDCHYFEENSVNNETEAIVHDSNILEIADFNEDYSEIINRIIVYGKEVDGLPLIYTAESTDKNYGINSELGVKEQIIKDENITTMDQVKERANYELSIIEKPPLVGEITSIGLATIQPGEMVKISAPDSNLPPNYYKIISYKHQFRDFMKTTVYLNKESRSIPKVLRERATQEENLAIKPNPREMRYSWNSNFTEDIGIHSGTEIDIIAGVLKLQSGQSSGVWISPTINAEITISEIESRLSGDLLSGSVLLISLNDGLTYTPLNFNGERVILSGNKIKIKILLNSSNTQIKGVVALYK